MYQFVEDLKEEQYKNFIQAKKLKQKRSKDKNCLYVGVAKERKLVACCKIFIQIENRKNIFSIPLGIQTIIEEEELYTFFMKYLIITARKYSAQKIKVYSKENPYLLKIGFKKVKKNSESYLPLKKEKERKIPNYFQIVELDTDRKREKLKNFKINNKDLFLFNNVSFFTLQLDLYTYLDTLVEKKERNIIQEIIGEVGDVLILECISIEYLNDNGVQYIDYENYSSLLEKERENVLFPKLKEELVKKGIQKLFLPKKVNASELEQEFIIEYEYSVNSITNFILKRG